MDTLDRIVRIIYKELPLSEFVNRTQDVSDIHRKKFYAEYFNFSETTFKQLIREKYIEIYPNNYSPDEVDHIMNYICLKIKHRYSNCHALNSVKLLLYIADEMLFLNANTLRISFDKLLELNGFINKIDGNILIAAKLSLMNSPVTLHQKYRVLHDNERLSSILSEGIAENHMHLKGSGYATEMNWHEFVHSEKTSIMEFEKVIRQRNTFTDIREIISLYKIRWIRAYLFSELYKNKKDDATETTIELQFCSEDIQRIVSYSNLENYEFMFSQYRERFCFWNQQFKAYYHIQIDSDKSFFLIERAFLKDLFDLYLRKKMTPLTLYCFNVYLLAISKFKLFFHQDNIGMGFEKFKYSEDIKESLIGHYGNEMLYRTVFDKYYEEKYIRKIELRVTPKMEVSEYKNMIDEIEYANKTIRRKLGITSNNHIEYGLIIHYIKDKSEFNNTEGISRKERTYDRLYRQCAALISFFKQYEDVKQSTNYKHLITEEYRNKIVGIDAANYELNCRPELFGYIFRRQRKELYSCHKLKFTYHVGEDFVTLANGLRAIDEVIEFLNFRRGDRLGHAIALGIDVDKYFETKREKVLVSIEEYLDDLVWMKYLISSSLEKEELQNQVLDKAYSIDEILHFLEEEFYRYFTSYYDMSSITIYDYYCAYNLRGDDPFAYVEFQEYYEENFRDKTFDWNEFYYKLSNKYEERLNTENIKHKQCFMNEKARDLFCKYHFSQSFKKIHHKNIVLDARSIYKQAVKMAQYELRKKVYLSEIGIESNPTSNRKISFTQKYIDLPFLNFNRMYLDPNSKYNLSISINTDDGGIFQTDLSLEYAYVAATLEREGYDIEMIYQYIDYLRENSMTQSFVSSKSDFYNLYKYNTICGEEQNRGVQTEDKVDKLQKL